MKLLKIEEAMEILQVSRSLIYKMIDSGELPFLKVGSLLRITEDDLIKYIETQKQAFADKKGQTFKKEIKKKKLRVIM